VLAGEAAPFDARLVLRVVVRAALRVEVRAAVLVDERAAGFFAGGMS
jgi:hypothetical protein